MALEGRDIVPREGGGVKFRGKADMSEDTGEEEALIKEQMGLQKPNLPCFEKMRGKEGYSGDIQTEREREYWKGEEN